MKTGKKIISAFLAAALAVSATACGTVSAQTAASGSAAGSKTVNAETVVIGTEGAYPPYNLVDSNGQADGYDIAVARAVDDLLPDIQFKYQPTQWDSIFAALDSGKYSIIVSQICKNPQREAKYQFSEKPYSYTANSIIYKNGRKDIKSLKDLHGKTVAVGYGSNNTTWLENYNKKNGGAIHLKYYEGDISQMLQDIIAGRVDATVNSEVTTKLLAKKNNINLGYAPALELGIDPEFFLFAKNEKGNKYKAEIDKALKTLNENGTLKKISEKYLEGDYTTEEAVKATLHK